MTLLLSARSLAQGHGIEVWNGFDEFPSPAMVPGWLKVVDGRLVSQYPDLFPILALPAFRLFDLRGLMLINLVAFAGVCTLTFVLARRRFGGGVAAGAVALLAGASFAFEYAVGAWPHMTAALAVIAMLMLLAQAIDPDRSPRSALALAAGAGFVGGLGIGMRLDVAFAVCGLGLALAVMRPSRWRLSLALLAGTLPGLTVLALLNRAKFGSFNPLSYGPSYYGPGVGSGLSTAPGRWAWALLAAVGLAVWATMRGRLAPGVRRLVLGGLAATVVVVAVAWPVARAAWVPAARGLAELTVDLRLRSPRHVEAEPGRRAGDPVRNFGALRKALLQSVPWAPLGLVALWGCGRSRQGREWNLLATATVAAFVLPYGFLGWDGGWALNQRYFLPTLPVLAVLAAAGVRGLEVQSGTRRGWPLGLMLATLTAAGLAARGVRDSAVEAGLLLSIPLLAAGGLVVSVLCAQRSNRGWARAALAFGAVAVGLGVVSCLVYDLPRALERRAASAARAEALRSVTSGPTLVLSEPSESLAAALSADSEIRLANPAQSGYRDLRPLVDLHLARGHRVVGQVPAERFGQLLEAGLARVYEVKRVGPPELQLFELRRPLADQAP